MLVVMQEGATEEQIEHVIDRLVDLEFDVHRSTGVIHTVLGGVGGKYDFDVAVFQVMEGVKEAHRIASPYKLASRVFRPGGTIVRVGALAIGGDTVVVMAGPWLATGRSVPLHDNLWPLPLVAFVISPWATIQSYLSIYPNTPQNCHSNTHDIPFPPGIFLSESD